MVRIISALAVFLSFALVGPSYAGTDHLCPRPVAGSEVLPPPDLFSSNGTLNVAFNYYTAIGVGNITLFCFETPDGIESPTFHVNPGDTINITLTNMMPKAPNAPSEFVSNDGTKCGSIRMTLTSINMHFHGINTSPKCHSDEVIRTLVNSGQTFTYKIKIPKDEPPGLYWYHPHIHGVSSPNVQGGASGAIIVEGIENLQPIVAGLPERLLILRDQPLPAPTATGGYGDHVGAAPFWDLSVNYVPVTWPKYQSAIIKMQAGKQEFWRIANSAANSILDLQLMYDGKAQPLQIVGFDGVPTGSQDGKRQGTVITKHHVLIPPAGRVELVLTAPDATVKQAALITNHIDSGAAGDYLPARQLAVIQTTPKAPHLRKVPAQSAAPNRQRFENLADAKVTGERKLFFSEVFAQSRRPPPNQKLQPEILLGRPGRSFDSACALNEQPGHLPCVEHLLFFITVDGDTPVLYDPNNPPAITTTRGAVEDWTIENQTTEVHEFHMHQIHFLVLDVNGKPLPKEARQFYDTYQVPYWDGVSKKYPSIKVRMDFRGAVTGDFVYHCHILDHEDGGMMAIIRVLPAGSKQGQKANPATTAQRGGGKLAAAGRVSSLR